MCMCVCVVLSRWVECDCGMSKGTCTRCCGKMDVPPTFFLQIPTWDERQKDCSSYLTAEGVLQGGGGLPRQGGTSLGEKQFHDIIMLSPTSSPLLSFLQLLLSHLSSLLILSFLPPHISSPVTSRRVRERG